MTHAAPLCIFCGFAGELTKEDVIPSWMNRQLPPELHGSKFGHRQIWYDQGSSDVRPVKRRQTRSYLEIQNVCAECNNGWMSVIDNDVRPIVHPMLYGKAVDLSGIEAQMLAKWLVLKFMVKDSDPKRPYPPVISQQQRTDFMLSRAIPFQFQVFLGRYDGRFITAHLSYGFLPPTVRMFIFGRVLAIITYSETGSYFDSNPSSDFAIDLGNSDQITSSQQPWDEHRTQIWPLSESSATWPPETTYDSNVIDVIVPPATIFSSAYLRQKQQWNNGLFNAGFASQMFHIVECSGCTWHVGDFLFEPNPLT